MQQLDALSPQERTAAEEGATAFARGETPAPSTGTGSGSGTDAPTGDRPDGPTAPGQRPGTPPEDNLGTW